MTNLQEYDPLSKSPTLTIYMAKSGEKWVQISSDDNVVGNQLTRVLSVSHSYQALSDRQVAIGKRLTYTKETGHNSYDVLLSEWVVTAISKFDADITDGLPEFKDIQIAYCEREPISQEEVNAQSYKVSPSISVDSFGGDRDAYEKYKNKELATV
jgi:hypothetical protein